MNKKWWKEAVVYQIYPRSFMDSNGDGIGDLQGVIQKLDYIKDLGVDVIWMSPFFKSPNDDNGYDISDYCDIMDEFGTMEDFDQLLNEIHNRKLKLMIDLVVNHTSDEHEWFKQAISDPGSPYRDYYFFRDGKNGGPPNNWASHFGFSAWEKEPFGDQYFLHLYTKKQPDLNWDNPSVRREVYKIMQFWVDKGVDGFRMDVINYISKVPGLPPMPGDELQLASPYFSNGPKVHEYLQEMHREILSQKDFITVGEMVSVTTDEARLYTHENRNEINMVFTFEHMYVDAVGEDKWQIRPWELGEIKEVFSRWQNDLADGCWNSLYLNNHDQARMVSRFGDDKTYRVESAKMLGTFLHTLKGTPYIYQGEELGMTNIKFNSIEEYKDIDTLNHYKEATENFDQSPAKVMEAIYTKGRDNARTPMQWDDSPNAGFTAGTPWIPVNPNFTKINAKTELANPDSIFNYYKKLIELRKKNEIMVYGEYQIICEEHPDIYAYTRKYQGQMLLILLNFFGRNSDITLPDSVLSNHSRLLIGNYDHSDEVKKTMTLRPYEALVFIF